MSSPTVLTSGKPNRAFGTLKRVQHTCQESHHRRTRLSYAFFPPVIHHFSPLLHSRLDPVHLLPHHAVVKVRGQLPGCTAEPVLGEAVMSLSYSLTSSFPTWPNAHLPPPPHACHLLSPPHARPLACTHLPFSGPLSAPPVLKLVYLPCCTASSSALLLP